MLSYRFACATLVALGMALLLSQPAFTADKIHEGKVVKAGEGKLVMSDKDGAKKHTHVVAANAKITLDGKTARLADLKAGMFVRVTARDDTDMTATRIEARTKEKKSTR